MTYILKKGDLVRKKPLRGKYHTLRAKNGLKRNFRASGGIRKRRRKGELTKLKLRLWELCKLITRARYRQPDGTWICYTSKKKILLAKNVHTGHFIASSLCSPELRYDLKNLRPQSYNENINHSGNPLQFERNLIRDHGVEYVAELWLRNQMTKGKTYTKDLYLAKILEYQQILGITQKDDDKIG